VTPGAAIAGLRRCAMYYQRIAQVVLPFPSSARAVTPEPIPPWPAAGYQVLLQEGFWRLMT
jgi:hypothetical protein